MTPAYTGDIEKRIAKRKEVLQKREQRLRELQKINEENRRLKGLIALEPKWETISVRLRVEEKNRVMALCAKSKKPLSDFMRERLLR